MKSNLEDIDYSEVINLDGRTYADLRKVLRPAYRKVAGDLLKGYVFIVLICAGDSILIRLGYFKIVLALPISAFLIGYVLAYLHLFIHAAAHYELHPDKTINDRISDRFIGVFFGISVKNYRKIHWLHHSGLGTTQDSEHSYFNELNLKFILKSVTGIHTFLVVFDRMKSARRLTANKTSSGFIAYTILFHLLLLLALFVSVGWLMICTWLAGLIIVFPAMAATRQILEHRDEEAQNKIDFTVTAHGKVSRLFGKGHLDSSFGAAGFSRHLLHHWDPTISYTRLREVEDFLSSCPQTATIIKKCKTSYLQTFIGLFKF